MHRVLVLSADPSLVATAEGVLRMDGREVRGEQNVELALVAVREWRPDLLLLDLSIGLTDGGFAALLRDEAIAGGVGVIAVAQRHELDLVGAGVAIDDFVVAPVEEEELRRRVARTLWDRTGATDGSILRCGGLLIDLERYKVTVDGDVVDLTYKEYELLRFLASSPGKPFTREALLNQVWGYDYYGGSRTVDVHVRRIRSKIEHREPFIETVRNVGYRFVEVGR
jgi:two-component system alkaline phosphatase synthesis response regulator PhoP